MCYNSTVIFCRERCGRPWRSCFALDTIAGGWGGGIFVQQFAKAFYKSKSWQRTRGAYMASVGGLCEECLAHGLYKPGEIVHHKVALTPENISDPSVALSWDNLKLVCRDCHAKEHGSTKRYKVDEFGRVSVR